MFFGISGPAFAQVSDWGVSTSPARLTVEIDKDSKPSAMSWTDLCLPNPHWAGMTIRVFDDSGNPVGSQMLWNAPGEPTTLLFDSSSNAKRYDIYFGSDWPPLPMKDIQQGVLLESRAGTGAKPPEHLSEMLDAWNKGDKVLGRAIVPGIFEGGNRFGPPGPVMDHLQGWFEVPAQEHLEVVTMSTDASFVLIDGKPVVEWPGKHHFGPGVQGQFRGAIDLPPGRHMMDYYNDYVSVPENWPLLACAAIKSDKMDKWMMLMPDNTFFSPTAHAHAVEYALQTGEPTAPAGGNTPQFGITWAVKSQSLIAPEVTDIGLISEELTCLGYDGGTETWTFDDGSTAEGATVTHLFPRPGLRNVRVTVKNDAGTVVGIATQTFNVHPDWTLLTHLEPQLLPADLKDLMARDPATMTAPDLASCFAVFEVYKNTDGLLKFLPALCVKMKDVADGDLSYLKDAAQLLIPDLVHAADASQLLHALVDRCSVPNPPPVVVKVGSQARLALAQLTLTTTDKLDEVRSLTGAISVPSLTGEEHHALDILNADLTMASGDVASAHKQYEALTGAPSGPDERSSIRQTAEIAQARVFLDRKDYEAAADKLNEVVQQKPLKKMEPDWALTRLRLYQDEGLPLEAMLWAKRLMPVIVDNSRSELLFRITELANEQKAPDLAAKTLSELLKKYPYSEEAAEAKQKWPATP